LAECNGTPYNTTRSHSLILFLSLSPFLSLLLNLYHSLLLFLFLFLVLSVTLSRSLSRTRVCSYSLSLTLSQVSVAIDFTGSNGSPKDKSSLHYVGSDNRNDYERALAGVLDVLLAYDQDDMVFMTHLYLMHLSSPLPHASIITSTSCISYLYLMHLSSLPHASLIISTSCIYLSSLPHASLISTSCHVISISHVSLRNTHCSYT